MTLEDSCPRCGGKLTPTEDESRCCKSCRGLFVPGSLVREDLLEGVQAPQATGRPEVPALRCPGCGGDMSLLELAEMEIERCAACGGVWLDAGESLAKLPAFASLGRGLLYLVSLPERALRSVIGLGAGTVKEMAEFIVPQAFQDARTYKVVVRNSLAFLTDDVGGAVPQAQADEIPKDYIARKAVGNFVDLAGIATLHFSPLWLLAIVSDVAYGTRTYVQELAGELKSKGLIGENSTIEGADDLLRALQDTSAGTSTLFDTPPLSIAQLKNTLVQVKDSVASASLHSVLPEAELKRYWKEMREIASRENVSLLAVSSGLTLRTLQKMKTVSSGMLTGIQVAGGLFHRNVVGHYTASLREVQEHGFYATLKRSYAPYVEALWRNLGSQRSTLTGEVVSGRAFGKVFGKLSAWLRGKGKPGGDSP